MANNLSKSPRQKMINLMYLVFIAMLALNVSAEVLDGFDIVGDSLNASSQNMDRRNGLILDELERYNRQNPQKAGEWYAKSRQVKTLSDSLVDTLEELKIGMVRIADGKKADLKNIRNKENLDAASFVMLSPANGKGRMLRENIDRYRETVTELIYDNNRREIIGSSLNTTPHGGTAKSWEQSLFENMPVAAAVTILTKIQNDVRASEGEALASLLHSIDVSDFRVNRINAFVIPESKIILRGGDYKARIVLSAEDSTHFPRIVVNGSPLPGGSHGLFTATASTNGTFPVEGYIELAGGDGSIRRQPFTDSYTVIEPTATIAPEWTNVLYAGVENEISISVPGVAPQELSATMTNGSLTRQGHRWSAKPDAAGQEAAIAISARSGTQTRLITTRNFRVRPLPDPSPFLEYTDANGNPVTFKGGSLPKAVLMDTGELKAAIDDGILNIPFRVTSFRTLFFDSMGNAIPEVSDGNRFSERQKEQIRRLQRGKYFYISGVRAVGPDGSEREIAVIEVRVG